MVPDGGKLLHNDQEHGFIRKRSGWPKLDVELHEVDEHIMQAPR